MDFEALPRQLHDCSLPEVRRILDDRFGFRGRKSVDNISEYVRSLAVLDTLSCKLAEFIQTPFDEYGHERYEFPQKSALITSFMHCLIDLIDVTADIASMELYVS